jgi:two-component system response regulator YesN
MPFKDGLELLQDSIAEYKYDAIIISGYGEFEYAKKAINLGVTEYLLKPIDPDELYRALKKIDKKRSVTSEKYISFKSVLDTSVYESHKYKIRHVSKMIEFIKNNYMKKVSLTELSREYGLTCAYLNSKFKEETSYTFNDFLNRYRILQSVKLLENDNLKIYEAAQKVGFTDYKYFIEVFKKYIGCSPTKFISSEYIVKKDIQL